MNYLIPTITLALSLSNGLASPILNGSFEQPALTTTQNISGAFTLPGWSGIASSNGGNAGLVLGPNNGLTPAEGLQHYTFNGGNPSDHGYLEQTIPTTPGASYSLTFALGRAGGGQSLSLTIHGQTFLPPPTTGYQFHNLAFTAGEFTTLHFTDTSGPNSISDLYLDAISVTPAPVPDYTPGCELALLLLLALRRR